MKLTKSKICLIAIPAIGCLILPLILSPLATKEAVAPDGKGSLEFLIFFLIFIPLFLLIVAGGIFSFVGLLFKSVRPSALLWFLASGACMTCYMGGCFAGSEISNKIRDKALEQIVGLASIWWTGSECMRRGYF